MCSVFFVTIAAVQLLMAFDDLIASYSDLLVFTSSKIFPNLDLSIRIFIAYVPTGIDNPAEYVLKPQREGGGNNIWDEEMKEKLISLKGDPARAQYILMKKIRPPIRKNKFVKRGTITEELDTVSEVGFTFYF